MIVANQIPSLKDLNSFVRLVPSYPVTAGQLVKLAKISGASQQVVDFYNDFPASAVFTDSDDLATRSEQIQMLDADFIDQPWEQQEPQE